MDKNSGIHFFKSVKSGKEQGGGTPVLFSRASDRDC